MLIENTAIDNRFINNLNKNLNIFFTNNKILNFYLYYFLNLKLKILFLVNVSNNNNKPYLYSIDKIFNNAN
jgi:hypothetical protein